MRCQVSSLQAPSARSVYHMCAATPDPKFPSCQVQHMYLACCLSNIGTLLIG